MMKIAVVGCGHGQLDQIYQDIANIEARQNIKIQLLLVCGDFEAIRNPYDLQCMAAPLKYRKMTDFYRYYAETKTAPLLTVFVGGNHEASNYLQELPFGGWVAKNIYYLGLAGVVRFGSLRIAGYSGIYDSKHYKNGHSEKLPYSESEKRSIYHVRNLENFRLKLLNTENEPIDIFMSHDWPHGIWRYGNVEALLHSRPYFQPSIDDGTLGSVPGEELLHFLRPKWYFSGHMHCRFTAEIRHDSVENGKQKQTTTRFLALDKVVPGRRYLEVIEIPLEDSSLPPGEPSFQLDPEWLCILKRTAKLWNSPSPLYVKLPTTRKEFDKFRPNSNDVRKICEDFGDEFLPPTFVQTAEPFFEGKEDSGTNVPGKNEQQPPYFLNPQTHQLCEKLKIPNPCIEWATSEDAKMQSTAKEDIDIIFSD